ncbi:MAG: hypothetical protein ABJZ55_18120 [Fuerstiella sp.]
MLKRRNTRRHSHCHVAVEIVEPRIVLSAAQPIVISNTDNSEPSDKDGDKSKDNKGDVRAKATTVAAEAIGKTLADAAKAKTLETSSVDARQSLKVADHLAQQDFAAREMILEREQSRNLKDQHLPETELSPGDLGGRNQVGQDGDDEMTFSEEEVDMFDALHGDDEDAAIEATFYLVGSGAIELEEDAAARRAQEAEAAAEKAAREAEAAADTAQSHTQMPTPDEAGGAATGSGDHDPDREDLAPSVGDPTTDDESGPTAQVGNINVGNTNWGEGNYGPADQAEVTDPAAKRVIDIHIHTLGGTVNPLPIK